MSRGAVFNTHRRRLRRKHVSPRENLASVLVLLALGGLIGWVLAQRERYDPADRDLPAAFLVEEGATIELYHAPARPWVESGAAGAGAVADLGLFPATLTDPEWQLRDRVRTFTADNLYEKINGEAERFLKQGFRSMSYAVLRSRGGSELGVELYDQGDRGGSMAVFADHHAADRAVEEQAGVVYFLTSTGVVGRIGRYFFRAAGDRESERIRSKAMALVAAFSALEDEQDDDPLGFQILAEGMALNEADIAFQRANVFQFDFAHDFWFGRLSGQEPARLFVHVGASAEEAEELLSAILEEQQYEHALIDSGPSWSVLRHHYLATYFVIGRSGRIVFGAQDLEALPERVPLMRRLQRICHRLQ